jgi:hypothetical protein
MGGAQAQQCAGNLVNDGPIRGLLRLNQNQKKAATNAVAQLTFADLYRAPPFRITVGNVRLDAQANTGKHTTTGRYNPATGQQPPR